MSFLVDIKRGDAKLQIASLQNLPSKTSARSYTLTAAQSKTEDGGLELEFVLSAKPSYNTLTIPLAFENVVFHYQPPLTEEYLKEDCEVWTETYVKTRLEERRRPENVVGSYAVYHTSKRNNECKTGKICHIFRPKLVDTDGREAWAEFNRDADKTGILTITLPQEFLDSARYPVVIDPTFGYTSVGASSWTNWYTYKGACKFTLSEAGTVTHVHFYPTGASDSWRVALYSHSSANNRPLNRLTLSNLESCTANAWHTFDVPDVELAAGTYWLAWGHSTNTSSGVRYDSGGSQQTHWDYYGTLENPWAHSSGGYENAVVSVYATYTTGAVLKEVADSLGLSDAVLRHKPAIAVLDGLGASDAVLDNKNPLIVADAVSLADLIEVITGAIIKTVSDVIGTVDLALVNRQVAVADVMSVLDTVFRHKPAVSVLDVVSAAEAVLVSKLLATLDSLSLTDVLRVLKTLKVSDILSLLDEVSTPSRVLQALDAVGVADGALAHKTLMVTETVSLVEVAEVGTGIKKTRLFLIIGDLAVQLTGD